MQLCIFIQLQLYIVMILGYILGIYTEYFLTVMKGFSWFIGEIILSKNFIGMYA